MDGIEGAMPEPRKAPRPASVSRAREGASTRGASGGLMMAAAEHDRRRVDPRVALAVLVLLNVAVFASGAKAIELLTKSFADPAAPLETVRFKPKLVERESVARRP